MRLAPVLLSSLIVCFTGCTTVVSVDRAQEIATAGTAYAETMKKVNDLAFEKSVGFTGSSLARDRDRSKTNLDTATKNFLERGRIVGEYSKYLDTLAAFFKALDALAKGNQGEATASAVSSIVGDLKKAPLDVAISDDRQKSLAGLSAVVATHVHGAAVEKALRESAGTVAAALEVSDAILDRQIRWIKDHEEQDRADAYRESIERPFLTRGATLNDAWRKNWESYVRSPAVTVVLADAKAASKAMQVAWSNALRGPYSEAELASVLRQTRADLDAVAAVKVSR